MLKKKNLLFLNNKLLQYWMQYVTFCIYGRHRQTCPSPYVLKCAVLYPTMQWAWLDFILSVMNDPMSMLVVISNISLKLDWDMACSACGERTYTPLDHLEGDCEWTKGDTPLTHTHVWDGSVHVPLHVRIQIWLRSISDGNVVFSFAMLCHL